MLNLASLHDLLQPIVGEPLSDMWRGLGQIFEFGEQRPDINRRGQAITRGDFSLKFISADWRIVQAGRLILGSTDHYDEERFYDSEEPLIRPYDDEARSLIREFFESVRASKFVVESVEVGPLADVTVRLSHDLLIQSFGSSGQDKDLWWFDNGRTEVSCLVYPTGPSIGERRTPSEP